MTFAVIATPWSLEDVPERLTRHQVKAIEISHQPLLEGSEEEIIALRNKIEQQDIRLWSVHAPFGKDNNLAALDASERYQALGTQIRLLPLAAMAGAEVVIIHPGIHTTDEKRHDATEALRRSLPEITRAAEEAGIRLGLENMLPAHVGDDEELLCELVEEIDSHALGICFDTGHAHCNRRFRQVFETLKPHIITFHLQDNDATRDLHIQPGYGTVPWWEFVEVFRTMDFRDPIVVEAWPWNHADFQTMIHEMELLFEHSSELRPTRLSERFPG